jgi:predicted lysophospholipase L1 biosynthesis ABC-type transport system permease subunit
MHLTASHQDQARQIAAELAKIAATGMVLPGSLTQRRTHCGHPRCACHADPPRLHGPYWQWTRKVAAKTTGRWLSPDQHHDYDRRLRELLARLEALGTAAFEADPRWQRKPRAATAATADTGHDGP